MTSPVTAKYLSRHASEEAASVQKDASMLATGHEGPFDHVCVLPAFDESIALLDGLAAAAASAGGRCLFIMVVNATDAAGPAVHAANRQLIDRLIEQAGTVRTLVSSPGLRLLVGMDAMPSSLEILLVDRASEGRRLAPGEGVGLARRIGCDVALALRSAGLVRSRFVHTTDADVTLPCGYFEAARDARGVALAYPFWHDAGDSVALALYEIWLRYYVLGLAWAGSPYACHTIGSTLAVDMDAYAACRGIPRRLAGEDFYLVNKLVKLGAIDRPRVSPIRIQARPSERVPFGTGPATRRIAAELADGRDFRLYHPDSFAALARWLAVMEGFAGAPASDPRALFADSGAGSAAFPSGLADQAGMLALERVLGELRAFEALVDASRRTRSPAALRKRLADWFDGFRTLKLMHGLRDAGLVDLPWREALGKAPFCAGIDVAATPCDVRRALLARE